MNPASLNAAVAKCQSCDNASCPIKRIQMLQHPKDGRERYEVAKILLSWGLSIIPVPIGKKYPAIPWKEYQTRFATDAELQAWFLNTNNTIGIVTGKISQLVVIDLDSDAAVKFAREHLPHTTVKVKTKRGEHWYYTYPQMASLVKNKVRIPIGGLTLDIDVRGDGGFVMGMHAVHPSGSYYDLIKEG